MALQRRLHSLVVVSLFFVLGWQAAHAQEPPPTDRTFSPQIFHPAVGPDEFLTVEPAQPLAHLNLSVKLWFNFARSPLAILTVDGQNNQVTTARARLVRNLLAADVLIGLGIANRLQLGVGIPLSLYQDGENFNYTYRGIPQPPVPGARGFALGDPWFDIKVRLYGRDRGFNLSIGAMVTTPGSLATPENYGGDPNVGVAGRLLAGYEAERWRLGVLAGYHWRAHTSRLFSTTIGPELRYAGAFAYDILAKRRLSILAELNGRTGLNGTSLSNIDATVLEVDGALKVRLGKSFFWTIGGGTGLLRGVGAPVFRALTGITWELDRRDGDRDGVRDIDDKCLDKPEDRDGFQDGDGCPDPDNDRDGVPDDKDRCPTKAEDFDEFEDEDGCPELDNDQDGIPDIQDACPTFKEDGKPPKDKDGCPLEKTDDDGDGVPNHLDKCPDQSEDKDGFQDDDGCPDTDNDQDGYGDKEDQCPNESEDFDQFQDEDGCPDPDNDHDGVLDEADRCPNEKETINGVRDNDGCPDSGPEPKVQVFGNDIVILEKVLFDNKATIQSRSYGLLDQLALTLQAYSEFKKIRIEGHTDSQGNADANRALSQERAEAVKAYLVKKGIKAERLEAQGLGGERPVADNDTPRGREANRRIEFKIIERATTGGTGSP